MYEDLMMKDTGTMDEEYKLGGSFLASFDPT
jgi:hypothetical protein